jgi:hypothetical protein
MAGVLARLGEEQNGDGHEASRGVDAR